MSLFEFDENRLHRISWHLDGYNLTNVGDGAWTPYQYLGNSFQVQQVREGEESFISPNDLTMIWSYGAGPCIIASLVNRKELGLFHSFIYELTENQVSLLESKRFKGAVGEVQ